MRIALALAAAVLVAGWSVGETRGGLHELGQETPTLDRSEETATALASATWEPTPNLEEWRATARAAQATGTQHARAIEELGDKLATARALCGPSATGTSTGTSSPSPEATPTAVPTATASPTPTLGAVPSPSGYMHATPADRPILAFVPIALGRH